MKLEISREFRDVTPAIRAKVETALERVRPQLEARAKAEAPVYDGPDKRRRPGALRDSTRANLVAAKTPELHLVSGSKQGGDDPFYARFVEYGTVKKRANPYIRRTIRKEKKNIASILKSELEKKL